MTIKKVFFAVFCIVLIASPAFATDYYPCTALTGGGTGALDSIDGSGLESGDVAITTTSSAVYFHRLDATSAAAASSPTVISPASNAGNKRWLLVGVNSATFEGTSGTSVNEFSTDGTLSGNSDDAVPTEKAAKTYVDTQVASVAAISNFAGYVDRPSFAYKDGDEIYINPGRYHHDGTSEQMVYWDSKLTFVFGPGGSNAGSSALAASDWFYLYVDDSAVVSLGAALLTSAEFVASTTAPTYSVAKHGFYNGNDRCIGAFITNSSSNILGFYHDGGDYIQYDSNIQDFANLDLDSSWENVTLSIPSYCQKAIVTFLSNAANSSSGAYLEYRVDGSSGDGHRVGWSKDNDTALSFNSIDVMASSSQRIEIRHHENGAHQATVWTNGWYFPRGM